MLLCKFLSLWEPGYRGGAKGLKFKVGTMGAEFLR